MGTAFLTGQQGTAGFELNGEELIDVLYGEDVAKGDLLHLEDILKMSPDCVNAGPDVLPTGTGLGTAFSLDGVYMSVAHDSSPFITIYKRNGDVFTKLTNPVTLPTNISYGTAFSPDGNYMSVAHTVAPFITIYKRNGDIFTKLTNPTILPTGTGLGTAFSPDGNYMSVAHLTTPFITIYKRSGDTFTKLTNPDVLPIGAGYGTAFSPDGVYLNVAYATSPFIISYKRGIDIQAVKAKWIPVAPQLRGYAKMAGLAGERKSVGKLNF